MLDVSSLTETNLTTTDHQTQSKSPQSVNIFMKALSTQQKNTKPLKESKRSRNNATELAVYLAERECQRQALVRSLKGKFSDMKFCTEDLIKQRRR